MSYVHCFACPPAVPVGGAILCLVIGILILLRWFWSKVADGEQSTPCWWPLFIHAHPCSSILFVLTVTLPVCPDPLSHCFSCSFLPHKNCRLLWPTIIRLLGGDVVKIIVNSIVIISPTVQGHTMVVSGSFHLSSLRRRRLFLFSPSTQ